jgi:hypothetical protein
MIKNFLHIYKTIYIVITISKNKAFKDKKLLITKKRLSQSSRDKVVAYGCLIKRREAWKEHLDYIYKG